MNCKKMALRELKKIPGIGKSLAMDLFDIGVRSIPDLRGKRPTGPLQKIGKA
jgi:nucleotidyltransferase/DNA polymerase involved in DNA repair